jgi:two-component system OmpR family response regulator
MKQSRILFIEDHPQVVYSVRPALRSLSYEVDHARTLDAAYKHIQQNKYDLIVLDRVLPDGEGLELISAVQDFGFETKTLVLSDKGSVSEKVKGLSKGADDYMSKPFALDELTARIQSLLRRHRDGRQQTKQFFGVTFDIHTGLLFRAESMKRLNTRNTQLLLLFLSQPGYVVRKNLLAEKLWTVDQYPSNPAIVATIRRFRAELSPFHIRVLPRRNEGYVLADCS